MQEYISIAGFPVVTSAHRVKIDLPEIMIDPINMTHFTRPIYLKESGRVYEHKMILKWLDKSLTDPITRKQLTYKSFSVIPALNIFAAEICIQLEQETYYYWPPAGTLLSLFTFCSEIFTEDSVTIYFEKHDNITLEQILYCCPFTGRSLGSKYKLSSNGMPMCIDCDVKNDAAEICFLQEYNEPLPLPPLCKEVEVVPHKFLIMSPSVELQNCIRNYINSSEIFIPNVRKLNELLKDNKYELEREIYHIRKFFMLPVMFNTEYYIDYSFLHISNLYLHDVTLVRYIFIHTSFSHVRFVNCTFIGCIFHTSCKAFDFEMESCSLIQCVDELDD